MFIMIFQLIIGLGFLVLVHELGHFLFARLFGMRVEKFVIFMDLFDFKLLKFRKGKTEYSIGWLPIGGYVKISGMVDESMDIDQLKEKPKPWEFRSFSVWKRIIVLLGGVIVNFIVAIIIFWGITFFGEKEFLPIANITDGIYVYEPGKSLGFLNGDIITKVNGNDIHRFQDVSPSNIFDENIITVLRGDKLVDIKVPPRINNRDVILFSAVNHNNSIDSLIEGFPAKDSGIRKGDKIITIDEHKVSAFGDIRNILVHLTKENKVNIVLDRQGEKINLEAEIGINRTLGVSSSSNYKAEKYGIVTALIYGYKTSIDLLSTNISGISAIFNGELGITESVTGPIGIAKIYGSEFHAMKFWRITGLISLILAITNLLPIPALDGGQILIISVETLIGRELPERIKMVIQIIGLIIVLGLMLFTVVNDIIRF